jgi:hypothetical protein
MKLRYALVTLGLAVASPVAASPETEAMRAQLRLAEQAGLDPEALQSIRDVIESLEQEERELAAESSSSPAAPDIQVRKSYFEEIGRAELEGCTAAGELQIDSVCQAAMLRYSDYLATINGATAEDVRAEMWRRHELTAKSYLQALEDFAS